jgi:asparagine synthase (glutamine-hydrolysing)
MCGILGVWGSETKPDLNTMLKSLRHRGPDAQGAFEGPAGTLGHRRLSIMDPNGGDQPIYNETGSLAVIANGEIYNFRELKRKLAQRHTFVTDSDTEALIHGYEERGESLVNELDGMFAFAIADGSNLFAARDPIGIKPLYFAERENAFWFASELKTLAPYCENVREFPPGTSFHSKRGFSTFYTVPTVEPEDRSAEDFIRELRSTLEHAVTKRLMSDVPLGAFLSGGVDSSIIAAVARRNMDSLHTFTVGLEGSRDLEAARVVAKHLDTIHHEYVLTADELRARLPEIIYYLESFDCDLVRSAIPCYFTSRLAADYVKVILTGEGADELFAGYTYYRGIDDPDVLGRELRRSVQSLHNINLQRVDRMTMAHSIEGRVPFLDLEMILLGQGIPPGLKLSGEGRPEKWILRKAFEDLLPHEILWREKEQFDEGSGTVDLLAQVVDEMIDRHDARDHQLSNTDSKLRSTEESLYHKLFTEVFEHPEPISENVARWAERPDWIT